MAQDNTNVASYARVDQKSLFLGWLLHSSLTRPKSMCSFLETLGMNPLPATFALLAEFCIMRLRFLFPWWLLPVGHS